MVFCGDGTFAAGGAGCEGYWTIWDGRLAHVTQPRMTQIMNLLHLAPDIQEALLFQPRITSGKAAIHEKLLRPIAAEIDWGKQREMWAGLERV